MGASFLEIYLKSSNFVRQSEKIAGFNLFKIKFQSILKEWMYKK